MSNPTSQRACKNPFLIQKLSFLLEELINANNLA